MQKWHTSKQLHSTGNKSFTLLFALLFYRFQLIFNSAHFFPVLCLLLLLFARSYYATNVIIMFSANNHFHRTSFRFQFRLKARIVGVSAFVVAARHICKQQKQQQHFHHRSFTILPVPVVQQNLNEWLFLIRKQGKAKQAETSKSPSCALNSDALK